MVTLYCAVAGVARSVFPVDIDERLSVGHLKDAIKPKINYPDPAYKLQLFLAKKDDAWLTEADVNEGVDDATGLRPLGGAGAPLNLVDLSEDKVQFQFTKEHVEAKTSPVHVLVVVPEQEFTGKRTRVDEWFVGDDFSVQQKKRRVDEDDDGDDRVLRYFRMSNFPPLTHPEEHYSTIVERASSIVIFSELMDKVKSCFENSKGANMVVTGNPGTGKSRFYLYCVFRLLHRQQVEVQDLPSFELVLNFGQRFHKYSAQDRVFTELDEAGVRRLSDRRLVLRLIEGRSSQLTGWKGVSILFAAPGLEGITDYAKTQSFTYIVPAWSLDELQDYNSLLSDEAKLPGAVLISRYNKFGGILRFIFTSTELENDEELSKAIATYSALDIISYVKSNHAVKDGNYSHRVLEMVPSLATFRAKFHLDFLSKYIAEQIVSRVTQDSIQKVSEFAIAHADDDSGSTSVARGKIYEMLCHKWFSLPKPRPFRLRSLCSDLIWDIGLNEMPTERFSSLKDIKDPKKNTFYRPTSKTFGALDAFIIMGDFCLGLQMTLNRDHGIKAAPLNKFLEWLEGVRIRKDRFYFVFVVPSDLADSFKKQTIRTKTDSITKKPGDSARVDQYVVGLDVFAESNWKATFPLCRRRISES